MNGVKHRTEGPARIEEAWGREKNGGGVLKRETYNGREVAIRERDSEDDYDDYY